MPLFQPVLYTILQLVVLTAIGFVLKRFLDWPEVFFRRLSKFLVTYALPLYLFAGIAHTQRSDLLNAGLFPLFAVMILAAGLGVSTLLFTVFRFRGAEKRAGIALGTFGNAAYLPLAVISIFQLTVPKLADRLGGGTPALYVGAFLLTFSPLLWTAGNLILTRGSRDFRVRKLVTPPFIGVALGFVVVVSGVGPIVLNPALPLYPVFRALEMLGNVTFPMILVSLGAMIADLRFGSTIRGEMMTMAGLVSSVRFVILPALFIGAFFLLRQRGNMNVAQLWVLFLEVSSPPATNFSVMAGSAGVNEHNTAFTLLVTYLVYMVALPLELLLFLSLPGIVPAGTL